MAASAAESSASTGQWRRLPMGPGAAVGFYRHRIVASPENSLFNFVHETPRAHLRFRCDPAPWLPPLSPSHGELIHPQGWPWRRPQQGWPAYRLLAGEESSRRSSRSKGCSKSKRIARGRGSKAAATNRWRQWAKHSDEQQSTSNQLQTVYCPPCEPRLTPHADDDSACTRC
jgi:hypothetical protein